MRDFNIKQKNGVIIIMPRSSKAWVGAEALWITAAGWAAAAKRKFGKAWVVTSDRIAEPEEVIYYPLVAPSARPQNRTSLRYVPSLIKIFIKDILLWHNSKKWNIIKSAPWKDDKVAFVWQQHDLFPGPGRKLATDLGVPLVTYVHGTTVWETAKWGVKRYMWGWLLENLVEANALRKSDVVACVSEEVAIKIASLGIDKNKILISPMAADPFLFENTSNVQLRKELKLEHAVVVGWIGSFRIFHGLDLLVRAFHEVHQKVPSSRLLLVGDGAERNSLEILVSKLNLTSVVIFAGRQPFARIPDYVSLFDVAVVSARSGEGFHYSPLKLREYLIAGRAVLAPNAGEIPRMFIDNVHLRLYNAGNVNELAKKLNELIQDFEGRISLGLQGKKYVTETSTWDYELTKLIEAYFK